MASAFSSVKGQVEFATDHGAVRIDFTGTKAGDCKDYDDLGDYCGKQIAKQLQAIGDPTRPALESKLKDAEKKLEAQAAELGNPKKR